ncbi:hypothetical protein V8E53_014003 [Lactarius tabidus]
MRQSVALETPNDVVVCHRNRRPDVGTMMLYLRAPIIDTYACHATPQPCGKLDCQQLARLWRLFTYDIDKQLLTVLLLLLFLSEQPRHAEGLRVRRMEKCQHAGTARTRTERTNKFPQPALVPHAIWVRPPTSSPHFTPLSLEDAGAAGPRNNDVRCRSARTFGQWRKIHVGGEEFEEGRELRPVPVQAARRPGMMRSETEVRYSTPTTRPPKGARSTSYHSSIEASKQVKMEKAKMRAVRQSGLHKVETSSEGVKRCDYRDREPA